VLDDDESDSEPDAAASDDATPPPSANDHDTSVLAVAAKPGAKRSATDGAHGGHSLSDHGVKFNTVNGIDQSRPSTHREYDRSPQRQAAKPWRALARTCHKVLAEYESGVSEDSLTPNSAELDGRSSCFSHRTNPVRDESLTLKNPSDHAVHDVHEHVAQDPDRTITPRPVEVGSNGNLYASRPTNTKHDSDGPCSQVEDRQLRKPTGSTLSTPNPPNPPSRKRSGPPAGSHASAPKQPRGSSRVVARRTGKAEGTLHVWILTRKRKRYAMYSHVTAGTKSGKLSTSAAYTV